MEPATGKIHRKCIFLLKKKAKFCKISDRVETSHVYTVLWAVYNCLQKQVPL